MGHNNEHFLFRCVCLAKLSNEVLVHDVPQASLIPLFDLRFGIFVRNYTRVGQLIHDQVRCLPTQVLFLKYLSGELSQSPVLERTQISRLLPGGRPILHDNA